MFHSGRARLLGLSLCGVGVRGLDVYVFTPVERLNGYMCVMGVKRNLWACCPSCYALICLGKGVRTRANTFGIVMLWWHDCC